MKSINLAFGQTGLSGTLPENWHPETIESEYSESSLSLKEMVQQALQNPVGTPALRDIVQPGETVCIVFSDITRSWQKTEEYLPLIVEELEAAGIDPSDITLLSALGTHRKQTEEEHRRMTGDLYDRCTVFDHDCDDAANMVKVGTTSRGTVVELNRAAVEADRLILTGGIVFHLMAGYSAGRKALVPGIASRKTIMQNHSLSLSPEKGGGSHPLIGCDRVLDNPLHEDLMEAQEFVKPDFIVNIVPGKSSPGAAVAGHYIKAHEEGIRILREQFLIPISDKRDLVIASAGGFPGDINFYQSVKSMINAGQALNEGGTMILSIRSQEGLGNPLMEEMIGDFSNITEREAFLRDNYTIGRFIAYYGCELADRFRVILVTEMDEPSLSRAGISWYGDLQQAIDAAAEIHGSTPLKCWHIPDASHSFPKV